MTQEELYGASDAADYLGVSVARLNEIRTIRQQAGQSFGRQIAKRWLYTKAELDSYKVQRDQSPKGGRPKSDGMLTPALPM